MSCSRSKLTREYVPQKTHRVCSNIKIRTVGERRWIVQHAKNSQNQLFESPQRCTPHLIDYEQQILLDQAIKITILFFYYYFLCINKTLTFYGITIIILFSLCSYFQTIHFKLTDHYIIVMILFDGWYEQIVAHFPFVLIVFNQPILLVCPNHVTNNLDLIPSVSWNWLTLIANIMIWVIIHYNYYICIYTVAGLNLGSHGGSTEPPFGSQYT